MEKEYYINGQQTHRFFDSGLGGLTAIPGLFKELPDERVIYFGDTARTPYGSKAVSTVRKYTEQITDFLVSKDVKMLVIACNTISSTCLDMLRERFPQLPVIGIIQPAAQKVASICNEENSIGVIATKVTINSGAYQKAIKDLVPQCNVAAKAAPAFVPLIEEGIIDNEIMDLTIHYYMDDFIWRWEDRHPCAGMHPLSADKEKHREALSETEDSRPFKGDNRPGKKSAG